VTFDIDANGIVRVSARDLGTGKEQKIKIESSSGLSEDEIKRMVDDAKVHEAEDNAKRELVEARNKADQAVYTTEKTVKEYGEKIGAEDKKKIEEAIEKVKSVMTSEDAKTINEAVESLMQASHVLAAEMYKQADASGKAGTGPEGGAQEASTGGSESGSTENADEGSVDADFEVVDDDDKK